MVSAALMALARQQRQRTRAQAVMASRQRPATARRPMRVLRRMPALARRWARHKSTQHPRAQWMRRSMRRLRPSQMHRRTTRLRRPTLPEKRAEHARRHPRTAARAQNTAKIYASSGSCSVGACSYTSTDQSCASGCTNGFCKSTGWTQMTSNTDRDLFGVWGSSASAVWAVGESGTAAFYNGVEWEVRTLPSQLGGTLYAAAESGRPAIKPSSRSPDSNRAAAHRCGELGLHRAARSSPSDMAARFSKGRDARAIALRMLGDPDVREIRNPRHE
jgi:hypothetical protein